MLIDTGLQKYKHRFTQLGNTILNIDGYNFKLYVIAPHILIKRGGAEYPIYLEEIEGQGALPSNDGVISGIVTSELKKYKPLYKKFLDKLDKIKALK